MADSISFMPAASEVDGHETAVQFKLHLAVGNVICIHYTKTQTQLKSAVIPGNELVQPC